MSANRDKNVYKYNTIVYVIRVGRTYKDFFRNRELFKFITTRELSFIF